ncbi:MAG TPA: hypothetical protein VI541_03930 [Actinomycetota bacterium]|nr:hypothetical protein [Actinomycetota bacterium]
MRTRSQLPIAFLMAGAAVVALFGSVTLALGGKQPRTASVVGANLPPFLFGKDGEEADVSPVDALGVIQDIAGENLEPLAQGSQSGVTTEPSVTPGGGGGGGGGQEPKPSMSLTMTARTRHLGGSRQGSYEIAYDSIVKNTGSTNLRAITFTSHVPAGTQWTPNADCSGNGYAITVAYDGGSARIFCVPGSTPIAGSDDPSIHPVRLTLDQSLAPGSVATISFSVQIAAPRDSDVVNHSHSEVPGLRVDSLDVTTRFV